MSQKPVFIMLEAFDDRNFEPGATLLALKESSGFTFGRRPNMLSQPTTSPGLYRNDEIVILPCDLEAKQMQ